MSQVVPASRITSAPQPPHIIRHYEALTADETDEVVETVADMIVNFVQKRGVDSVTKSSAADGQSSSEPQGNTPSGKEKGRR